MALSGIFFHESETSVANPTVFTTIAVYLLRKRDLARDAAARDAIRTPGTEQYNGSLGDTKDANEVVESEERTPVTAVLNDEGKHRL